MSSSTDDDSQQRFALGFLFALIALIVFSVVGFAGYKYGLPHASVDQPGATGTALVSASEPTQLAVVTETVTIVIPDGASIVVENGVVNFFFATGSADLAPGAAEALVAVIKGVENGRKAIVSGFHDTTGDAAINEALAQKRARMVRDVLVGLNVPANRIDLQKPAVTTASGSNAEARRVEVRLVD